MTRPTRQDAGTINKFSTACIRFFFNIDDSSAGNNFLILRIYLKRRNLSMKQNFYSLPLALDYVMHKKKLDTCSLPHSVASYLHLIMTTAFGELHADEKFGCSIWEYDFNNITSKHKTKEWIIQSLQSSIQLYEKRLSNVHIELTIRQEEAESLSHHYTIKKKCLVTITGTLQATNENFIYQDSFYTGPLSYQLI